MDWEINHDMDEDNETRQWIYKNTIMIDKLENNLFVVNTYDEESGEFIYDLTFNDLEKAKEYVEEKWK